MVGSAGLLSINATLLVEMLAFVLMLAILGKWVYPPVMAKAEERQKSIEAGLQAAAESEKRLEQVKAEVATILEEARAQARDVLDRAREEALADAARIRADAEAAARMELAHAGEEIQMQRDRALRDLQNEFANLVVDAAERVVGESLGPEIHSRLVAEALDDRSFSGVG